MEVSYYIVVKSLLKYVLSLKHSLLNKAVSHRTIFFFIFCQLFLSAVCEITLCFQARKKQLHRGKVPLLLCVVDSIDWHGCDLSVALKDRSGQDSCSVV